MSVFFISTQMNELKTCIIRKVVMYPGDYRGKMYYNPSTALDIVYFSKYLPHSHFIMYQTCGRVSKSDVFSLQNTKYQYGRSLSATLTALTLSLVLMYRNHMGGQCPLWTLFLCLHEQYIFYDEDRKAQEMYTTFLFTGQL